MRAVVQFMGCSPADFQAAEKLIPTNGLIQSCLGRTLSQLERYEESEICYQRAIRYGQGLNLKQSEDEIKDVTKLKLARMNKRSN